MPDYSHYSVTTAEMVASYVTKHGRPTDEMLLEAFERIEPPLLPDSEHGYLHAILSHKVGPRPRISSSPIDLADKISKLQRSDVPAAFLNAVADRILKRKGFTEYKRSERSYWKNEMQIRDICIRGLYAHFRDLQDGGDIVDHPIFGWVVVPEGPSQRSERAIMMVDDVLSGRLGMQTPSERSMMNIVAYC